MLLRRYLFRIIRRSFRGRFNKSNFASTANSTKKSHWQEDSRHQTKTNRDSYLGCISDSRGRPPRNVRLDFRAICTSMLTQYHFIDEPAFAAQPPVEPNRLRTQWKKLLGRIYLNWWLDCHAPPRTELPRHYIKWIKPNRKWYSNQDGVQHLPQRSYRFYNCSGVLYWTQNGASHVGTEASADAAA